MKTQIVQRNGKDYVELTPTPHCYVKHGLKIQHHAYDYYTNIKAGKKYYRLQNKQSVDHISIKAEHSKDSPIVDDTVKQLAEALHEEGMSKRKIGRHLGFHDDYIYDLI